MRAKTSGFQTIVSSSVRFYCIFFLFVSDSNRTCTIYYNRMYVCMCVCIGTNRTRERTIYYMFIYIYIWKTSKGRRGVSLISINVPLNRFVGPTAFGYMDSVRSGREATALPLPQSRKVFSSLIQSRFDYRKREPKDRTTNRFVPLANREFFCQVSSQIGRPFPIIKR